MADRMSKAKVQPFATQNDLLRMDGPPKLFWITLKFTPITMAPCSSSAKRPLKLSWNHSTLFQRTREHCRISKSAQLLEISATDRPHVSERHIVRDASFSSFSFDATERDDCVASSDKFFGGEPNIKGPIEAGEKALEHILKTLEMTASNRHAFWQIVYDVWCLYPA